MRKGFLIFQMVLTLIIFFEVLPNSVMGDEVEDALRQYSQESRDYRDLGQQTREEFYEKWLYSFVELIENNKDSLFFEEANIKAVGLANGLGKFDLSLEFINTLIERSQGNWQSQASWYGEAAEVTRQQYTLSKSSTNAEICIEYFRKVIGILEEHKTVLQGSLYAQKYPIYLMMLADLLVDANGDYNESADLYKVAREFISGLDDNERTSISNIGWDEEYSISKEADAAIQMNDIERSSNVLKTLENLPSTRWSPGFYFGNSLKKKYSRGGKRYRDLISNWVDSNGKDPYSPFLMFDLARDYMSIKDFGKAMDIYSELRDKHWDEIILRDENAIEMGMGGYSAEILFNLGLIYTELSIHELAIQLLTEFEELFPNDSRLKFAQDLIKTNEIGLVKFLPENDLNLISNEKLVPKEQVHEEPNVVPTKVVTESINPSESGSTQESSHKKGFIIGIGLLVIALFVIIAFNSRRKKK